MSSFSRMHNEILHIINTEGADSVVSCFVPELSTGGENKRNIENMFTYVRSNEGFVSVRRTKRVFLRTSYRGISISGPAWLMEEIVLYLDYKTKNALAF